MHITDYSRFHHMLSVLASENTCIEMVNGSVICHKKHGHESNAQVQANVTDILIYLVNHRAKVCKHDQNRLDKLRDRLVKKVDDTHLIDKVFDVLINNKEKVPEELVEQTTRLVHIVREKPEDADQLLANLKAVLQDPHLSLTQDLAVVDAYNAQLPANWNREKLFKILSEKIEEFKDNPLLSRVLLEVRDEYRNVQVTPIGIAILEKNEDDNGSVQAFLTASVYQGLPTITTKAMMATPEFPKDLEELLKKQDLEVFVQEPGSLVLLLPLKTSPQDLGFATEKEGGFRNLTKELKDIEVTSKDIVEDFSEVLLQDNETTVYRRIFAIHGHGLPKSEMEPARVCGMILNKFQNFLGVMNDRGAGLGIVNSCYSGGGSSESYQIPQGGLPFPIVVRSAMEAVSKGVWTRGDPKGDQTYRNLGCAISKGEKLLFPEHPTGRNILQPRQLTLRQLGNIADSCFTMGKKRLGMTPIHNIPTVFLPTTTSDIPRVAYIFPTEENVLDADAALRKRADLDGVVWTNKEYVIFGSPLFKGVLKKEERTSIALLSRGGHSHHVISELQLPEIDLMSLALESWHALETSGDGFPLHERGTEKLFFIGKLICQLKGKQKLLRDIVLFKRTDRAKILFKEGEDEHYQRINFRFVEGNRFHVKGKAEILSSAEYAKELYWALLESRPSEGHLRQTTAGRINPSEIYSEVRHRVWGDQPPKDALLFERVLLNQKELNGEPNELKEALRIAAAAGSMDSLRELHKKVGDINTADANGLTPLMCAAQSENVDLIQYLVDSGAKLDQQDKLGRTAFHRAICKGQFEFAKALLAHGADSTIRDLMGLTGSEWLLLGNHLEFAKSCWPEGQIPQFTEELMRVRCNQFPKPKDITNFLKQKGMKVERKQEQEFENIKNQNSDYLNLFEKGLIRETDWPSLLEDAQTKLIDELASEDLKDRELVPEDSKFKSTILNLINESEWDKIGILLQFRKKYGKTIEEPLMKSILLKLIQSFSTRFPPLKRKIFKVLLDDNFPYSNSTFKNVLKLLLDKVLDKAFESFHRDRLYEFALFLIKNGVETDWNSNGIERLASKLLDEGNLNEIDSLMKKGFKVEKIVKSIPHLKIESGIDVLQDWVLHHNLITLVDRKKLISEWIYPALKHGQLMFAKKLKDAAGM